MKYKLKVYNIWECGQRKDSQGNEHQEDNIFPESGKLSDDARLFILCDGMGGHDAGEVASATVCEAMSESILNDGHDQEEIFTSEDFSNALNAAFDALDKKDSGAEKKMGTTMTFLKLHDKGAFIAHIGDSRVYQIRSGKTGEDTRIVFQTEDHSLVNDLIKIGELTKEEARFSKQKNVITRAMQPNMGRRPKADIYETSDIKAGDYFYMCSDGMLEQPEMENGKSLKNIFSEMGGPDEDKVKILELVTSKNRDNHTAFIIHILEVEDPIEETITEKTARPVIDDKFTAIIEEETEKAESDDTQTDSVRNQDIKEEENVMLRPQEGDTLPIEKPEQNERTSVENTNKKLVFKKALYLNLLKFLGTAIIIIAAFIGFYYFKSCSNDKDKASTELIESSQNTMAYPAVTHGEPLSRTGTGADETSTESSEGAIEDASSSGADPSGTAERFVLTQVSGTGNFQFPFMEDPTDVVKSDKEKITELTK